MANEHEERMVISDREFEWMLSGAKTPLWWVNEEGVLSYIDGTGGKHTYQRQRDWEKGQEPFGERAQAARRRIEGARAERYRRWRSEPGLYEWEYGFLRNASDTELEAYSLAEEGIRDSRLEQRRILKAAGIGYGVWVDEERAEEYLHRGFDSSGDSCYPCWPPEWEALKGVLLKVDGERFELLRERIDALEARQREVREMVGARWVDSHPEKYPNG